jgi:hypothetical protein
VHPIRDIENIIHHHPEGDTMTDHAAETTSVARDAEEHVKQMIAWGQRFIGEALPAVASAAAKADEYAEKLAAYDANPAVQVIVKAALSPDRADQLADVLAGMVKLFGTVEHDIAEHIPAPDQPAEPSAPDAPAAPIVAGGVPV